jgi:hypothetical protein
MNRLLCRSRLLEFHRVFGNYVDNAGNRIGAIECRRRAIYHFDLFDILQIILETAIKSAGIQFVDLYIPSISTRIKCSGWAHPVKMYRS